MIVIKNIISKDLKSGSSEPILNKLSCAIPARRITTLVGKSGAGKTTILRSIAGLQPLQSGSILVNGNDLTSLSVKQRAHIVGFVFQDFNLFPHLTAFENCMQPLMLAGALSSQEAFEKVNHLFEKFDIVECKDSYPCTLSGGQKQRIAIARALCLEPKVLLLDEPTSALDMQNSLILVNLLQQLCSEGITVVVVSHDSAFVELIEDRVYTVENGKAVLTKD